MLTHGIGSPNQPGPGPKQSRAGTAAELLGYTEEEWDEEEDESEETEDEDDDVEPGQDLTLSWPLGQDPCKITWPF